MTLQESGGPEGPPRPEPAEVNPADRIVAALKANELVAIVGEHTRQVIDEDDRVLRNERVIIISPEISRIRGVSGLNRLTNSIQTRLRIDLPESQQIPLVQQATGSRKEGIKVAKMVFAATQIAPVGKFVEMLPQLTIAMFPNKALAQWHLALLKNGGSWDVIPPHHLGR